MALYTGKKKSARSPLLEPHRVFLLSKLKKKKKNLKNKLRCRSPQENYTDRATAACQVAPQLSSRG
jgi:hypothetical protein